MPRGDGTGPMGAGPVGRRGCMAGGQRFAGQRFAGVGRGFGAGKRGGMTDMEMYASGMKESAGQNPQAMESQADQLQQQAENLRSRAEALRQGKVQE